MAVPEQQPGPSRADTNVHSNGDADAGPSRRRSRSRAETDGHHSSGGGGSSASAPRRPASPVGTLSRHASPARAPTPHLDLATYPTPTLLRLLASLLQQIATANDQLRAEHDDEPGAAGGGGADSSAAGSRTGQPPPRGGEPMEVVTDAGAGPPAEDASATGSTQSRSSIAHPSPTTALFHDEPPLFSDPAVGDRLFTASKVSLSHPSSILSFHARHVPSISIEAYLLRILKYCPTTNEVFLGLLVYFDRMSKLGTPAGVGGTSAAVGPRGFAIDSYNVHRLIIAGVTVASKFFSDVFYTNSRYAKVGGLPPHELNQLELQFLLLNNFTLMIPPEEMQKYGDRLLAYWQGREHEAAGTSGADQQQPESQHRRDNNEREHRRSDRERSTEASSASAGARSKATPMQVDPTPPVQASQTSTPQASTPTQAASQSQAQASATAPPTPSPAPPAPLARSASLPRRAVVSSVSVASSATPEQGGTPAASTAAPRAGHVSGGVSGGLASVAHAATSLASGALGWSRAEDGAVGVGR